MGVARIRLAPRKSAPTNLASAMTKAYERGNCGVVMEFREYIAEWLSAHISVDDLEYSKLLRDRTKQ